MDSSEIGASLDSHMVNKINLFLNFYDDPVHISIEDGNVLVVHGDQSKRICYRDTGIENGTDFWIGFGPSGELRVEECKRSPNPTHGNLPKR